MPGMLQEQEMVPAVAADPRMTVPQQMLRDSRNLKFDDYWDAGENSWVTVGPALLGSILSSGGY